MKRNKHVVHQWIVLLLGLMLITPASAGNTATHNDKMSLSMRDMALSDVMSMLSRQQRVNILLSENVDAKVSFSLYDVTLDEAIAAISSAAGFAVEKRNGNYFIVKHESTGKYAPNGLTDVRSFEIEYANAEFLQTMLSPYLSEYGALTILEDRRLVVVEDTPEFMDRISMLLKDIDRKPRQILIEAQILEITLDDNDAFGIDWKKLFNSDGGSGSFGTAGLASDGANGFFFDLATPDIEVALDALRSSGRVRTLSTPKLLALENQESEVLIGDRKGYRVTTTINQITSESIEFLESGVILRVTPSIDADGGVMLDIHPEVSTGTVDSSGIPSQTTTEVTTRLLVSDGQSVFIGGLLKHTLTESRAGVPLLSNIPGVKRLFSNRRKVNQNTETIVLITPHIVENLDRDWNTKPKQLVESTKTILQHEQNRVGEHVTAEFPTVNNPVPRSGDPEFSQGHSATVDERPVTLPVDPRVEQFSLASTPITPKTETAILIPIPASHVRRVVPTHFVRAQALRVRFKPGPGAGIKDMLYLGDKVQVLSRSGQWSQVRYTNDDGMARSGWMASGFLDPV